MPDVIIKDMEMPKYCTDLRGNDCPLWDAVQYGCRQNNCYSCDPDLYGERRPAWCPLRPAPEWVSVEERLPESQKPVLVAIKSAYNGSYCVTTAEHINHHEVTTEEYGWQDYEGETEYDEGKDCFWVPEAWWETNFVEDNVNWEISKLDGTVTHWMPLPEPPADT